MLRTNINKYNNNNRKVNNNSTVQRQIKVQLHKFAVVIIAGTYIVLLVTCVSVSTVTFVFVALVVLALV
jgi:uncharacterized membrane protein